MYQQTSAKLRKVNASTEGLASGHSHFKPYNSGSVLKNFEANGQFGENRGSLIILKCKCNWQVQGVFDSGLTEKVRKKCLYRRALQVTIEMWALKLRISFSRRRNGWKGVKRDERSRLQLYSLPYWWSQDLCLKTSSILLFRNDVCWRRN